jgi:hypothetical protein
LCTQLERSKFRKLVASCGFIIFHPSFGITCDANEEDGGRGREGEKALGICISDLAETNFDTV